MINYAFSAASFEYFLMILVRSSCFVFICPFFSMQGVPNRLKVAMSVFISYFLYAAVVPENAIAYDNVITYALIIMKEAATGFLIGFAPYMCNAIFSFAGHISDMEIGLTMVQLMDPTSRQNVTFTGALYNYGFMFIMIASGMYRYLLGALVDSFQLIPINGAIFHTDRLLTAMITFLGDYVLLSFRIIFPIFATMLMLNAILGVMAKLSPQMNMFAVGVQLKIITGFSILFILISLMPYAADMIFEETQKLMILFVEAMT